MKAKTILVSILSILGISVATSVVAAGSLTVTPSVGYITFQRVQQTEDVALPIITLDYNVTPHWGISVLAGWNKAKRKDISFRKVNLGVLNIDGIYHILPHQRFQPYVLAGFGVTYMRPNGETSLANPHGDLAAAQGTINGGVGMQLTITKEVALRADVRDILTINKARNNILTTVGLSFNFPC